MIAIDNTVCAAGTFNVLAFMYASSIRIALRAVKTQLEYAAKLKDGKDTGTGNYLFAVPSFR